MVFAEQSHTAKDFLDQERGIFISLSLMSMNTLSLSLESQESHASFHLK